MSTKPKRKSKRKTRIGNPALIATAAASNPKAVQEAAKITKIVIYIIIALVIGLLLWFLVRPQIIKAQQNVANNEAGKANTPEYYAQRLWDLGDGTYFDTKFDYNEEETIALACQIGRDKNYNDVIKAFRKMFNMELADYLSGGLNTDEIVKFNDRATGKAQC